MNVTQKTIYRWIQSAGLPAYRVEGQYRLNRTLLLEWARAKRINISSTIFEEPAAGPRPTLEEALQRGGVFYRVEGKTRDEVLRSVFTVIRLPDTIDREFIYQAVLAREKMQSTGIGDGIAIPHVRNPLILEIDQPSVTLCFLENPVEFGAMDGQPVNVLFTLFSPHMRAHLHLLSRLSFCLQDPVFKAAIKQQASRDTLYGELKRIESSLPQPAGESTAGSAPA